MPSKPIEPKFEIQSPNILRELFKPEHLQRTIKRANRSRKQKLDRCRVLLDLAQPSPIGKKSARQLLLEVTGFDLARCPACHVGTLFILAQLPAIEVTTSSLRAPPLDSS